MANITTPNTLVNNTPADATQVQANFDAITAGLSNGLSDISVNNITAAGTTTLTGTIVTPAIVNGATDSKLQLNSNGVSKATVGWKNSSSQLQLVSQGGMSLSGDNLGIVVSTAVTISAGDLSVAGDVYTHVQTNYAASTVTGYSSTITKQVVYKTIGKTMFVSFEFSGTSDATMITFTVPYPCDAFDYTNMCRGSANGVDLAGCYATIDNTTNVVYVVRPSGQWTVGQNVYVAGQIVYGY